MADNVPIALTSPGREPIQLSHGDIRELLLESWVQGEVAETTPGADKAAWDHAAQSLKDDLDVHVDAPYTERTNGVTYYRANHGFPIEMHWNSPEAREWLRADPARRTYRNQWNDIFVNRGIA